MSDSKSVEDDREQVEVCGRCGWHKRYTEDPPENCPNCDYTHGSRDYKDVPEEVKLPIHR